LHPNYALNKKFYVDYIMKNGNTVIAEYTTISPFLADLSTERKLMIIEQPFPNHNGGQLLFGPDNKLYIMSGDGGSGGDPFGNGQKLTTLLGKILRIDVDTRTGGLEYGIPGDNPFLTTGGALPEIYAYGLRNPWRCSFDQQDNFWCGDVGQNQFEEIDIILKGNNYGWRVMEGNSCFFPRNGCDQTGLTLPVFDYPHSGAEISGLSVTGGYVYRGSAVPSLLGSYVFGDLTGGLFSLTPSSGGYKPDFLFDSGVSISTFGEDCSGELLIGAFSETDEVPIYRLKSVV
jgi:glucose/arabinose dehydrogenase